MVTRRSFLVTASVTGVSALARTLRPSFIEDSKDSVGRAPLMTPVNFKVPRGACDSHVHVFGDPQRFPFVASRTYTPAPALVDELAALHRALHIDRVVIVQPSVYGIDNSCTLDAIKRLAPNARGVAVIDDATTEASLDEMHRAGIRGIRLNLQTAFQAGPDVARKRLLTAIDRIKTRKWHIQLLARLPAIESLRDLLMTAPIPLVIDHFGGADAALGIGQPGFETLLNLVQKGKAHVKVSAAYRSSTQAPDYADIAPLAKALIAANPRRILWGTDWPHANSAPAIGRKTTDLAPRLEIDDGRVFNLLAAWAPNPGLRKTILVENPAKLYGF